jgi:hypothetical protein
METGHYYFNEMRSSFQTWFKISFLAHETQYLQKNLSESQQLHQQQCRKKNMLVPWELHRQPYLC